jgi:hypothetical protein
MPLARGEIFGYDALREYFHHCAMLQWGAYVTFKGDALEPDVVFVKPFLGQSAVFRVGKCCVQS